MFLPRSPRPWPPAAVLFALLIAATLIRGEIASAQTPASVPPAVPEPASSIPSVPAPTPANSQSTSSQPQAQQTQPDSAPQATPATQQPQTTQPQTAPPQAPQPQTQPPAPAAPTTAPDQLEQPIQVQKQQNPPTPSPVAIPPAVPVASVPSMPPYGPVPGEEHTDALGSTYIPVDNIVYPLTLRLYSLGYLDDAFIAFRPWTRRSLLHMLQKYADDITSDGDPQAMSILAYLQDYLVDETPGNNMNRGAVYGVETLYTRLMGIGGPVLRDSYHLGQTIYNDYGRPYATGFNNITGFSSVNEYGRFSLYVRGEYQHAPAYSGYSEELASELFSIDGIPFGPPQIPNDTVPYLNTGAVNTFRLQEVYASVHWWGHEISFGKGDTWMGPGMGGGMLWSNNAENPYTFRVNRVEPMYIPWVSKVLGPLRYDFMIGPVQGHSYPNAPWVNSFGFSFKPTKNFDFSFQKSAIWGGKGHGCLEPDGSVSPCTEPITLHTFLKSFFSFTDTTLAEKYSRDDPGARFSAFTFSWKLPFLRKYVTLYTDSICHDDVTPPSAPRRAAYRPGVYLSHFPHFEKLDLRAEASSTDTSTLRSLGGQFNYYETIQRQGYTYKGYIMGDWIGREAKGGNAWLTYHLSGDEWVQLEYMNKKTPKDFIPQGTTQNQFTVDVVKNLRRDIQLNAFLQYERWKAPIWVTGQQNDVTVAAEIKFYPGLHTHPQPVTK
jgi:hypothetical protein